MFVSIPLHRFLPAFLALAFHLACFSSAKAEGMGSEEPAASSSPAPLQESLSPDARREYDAARVLFDDQDFSGSIAKFKRAYQLSHDPRLLWNQAVCEKELRHYARASELIRRYLREGEALIEPQKRDDARRILDSLKQFSSQVVLSGVPPGSKLSIDGEPFGIVPLAEPLVLDLGSHRIEISHPGYRTWSRVVDVPGATPVRVGVVLQPDAEKAHISIRSAPDARITIDGSFVAEGRYDGTLAPGPHTIAVSARGRKTETRKVDLPPSSHRTMEISLKERSASRALPWILGGAALVGGVIATGYYVAQPGSFEGPTGSLGSIDARER